MNKAMLTIRDWLLQLPIDEATAALNNLGRNVERADLISCIHCPCLSKAVCSFMYWKDTEEGLEYWGYIYTREYKKETYATTNI